ncbi:hypothetical protein M153_5420004346 [Pseudoloma neurophilia]|uniref:Uncharacterized protein n=1 Tax=Pseudoloma neurophilia TaxID=146866 RepID=A0A0R0M4M6_9MICR|nr:hypothetical protein M153_5420004346 [Pseudoloma neurophilia]
MTEIDQSAFEDSSSESRDNDSSYDLDEQNYYKSIIINVSGNRQEDFEILKDELAYYKENLNRRDDKEGILLQITLGLKQRTVGLLDLLYCSVRYKIRFIFNKYKFLNKYFHKRYFTNIVTENYIYDGTVGREQRHPLVQLYGEERANVMDQLNEILSCMIMTKLLVPAHILTEHEHYNSFHDELALMELKRDYPKEKPVTKAPIEEEDNILPENKICSVENIKYSYDIDGLKGAIYLSKAHKFFKSKIFLNRKINTFITPKNKHFYYIHNGKFMRNTELFHVHLGFMEVNSLVFNFYGVTDLKAHQDILQNEFAENLEKTIEKFCTSKCRDIYNIFLANARVSKNRRYDLCSTDYSTEKILNNETDDLWRALRSNTFLNSHMPTIYVESFGMKADMHTDTLDACYQYLDKIDGIETINFLEHDICMMTSPKGMYQNFAIFQKIPDFIKKNCGHGKYSLFFSNTAEHINKKTIVHKPQCFKMRKDGITKFNCYNGMYKALMPEKLTRLKGSHLMVHQMKDTLDNLLKRKKKILKNRIDFTTLRANIENSKGKSFPFRNEIACEISLGSNNILRIKRKMERRFFLYDTNVLLNYILDFLNAFEAFLTVKNIDITLDNFIKGVICELILFETFLKGSLNRHSVNTSNYNKILKRLFRKDKIPKYNIDEIIMKILKKMKKHKIFDSIKKTLDYSMVERSALSDIKILYNIISKDSVDTEIRFGIIEVLKLSVDECTKLSGDSMHVVEWVTKLTDVLETKKPWIVSKAPNLRYAQLIIAITPEKKLFIYQMFLDYIKALQPNSLVKLIWKFDGQSIAINYTELSIKKAEEGFKKIEFRNSLEKRLNEYVDLTKTRNWSDNDLAKILFGLKDSGNNSVVSAFRDIRLGFFGFVDLEKFKSSRKNLNKIMASNGQRKEKILKCLNSTNFADITLNEWKIDQESKYGISLDENILSDVYDWAQMNDKQFRVRDISLSENVRKTETAVCVKRKKVQKEIVELSSESFQSVEKKEKVGTSVDDICPFIENICFETIASRTADLENIMIDLELDIKNLSNAEFSDKYQRDKKYTLSEVSQFICWFEKQKIELLKNQKKSQIGTFIQATPISFLKDDKVNEIKFNADNLQKMKKAFREETFTFTMVKRLLFNTASSEEKSLWKHEFEELVSKNIFVKPNPKRNAYLFGE